MLKNTPKFCFGWEVVLGRPIGQNIWEFRALGLFNGDGEMGTLIDKFIKIIVGLFIIVWYIYIYTKNFIRGIEGSLGLGRVVRFKGEFLFCLNRRGLGI